MRPGEVDAGVPDRTIRGEAAPCRAPGVEMVHRVGGEEKLGRPRITETPGRNVVADELSEQVSDHTD